MISHEDIEGIRVASVIGEINDENVDLVRRALKNAARGAEKCIVSLERCTSCDASGIAMLVSIRQEIDSGLVTVLPDGSNLREILRVAGLDHLIMTVDTVDGAIRKIKGAAGDPEATPELKIFV